MQSAIGQIMSGQCSESEIATLLTALAHKGETVEEIAGAAAAMRQHMTPVQSSRTGILDTCGTGGGGSRLFNVSTSAAIVASAAGVPVAKHGNRSVTSKTGSADVLQQLGVNIEAPAEVVARCLDEVGLCFCFARTMHPSMRHVAPVRAKLGIRTIFNLLGPLSNPARASFQLLGTGMPDVRMKLAQSLLMLDVERAVIITGEDGLGEVHPAGTTDVTVAEDGELADASWTPHNFGMANQPLEALEVEDAAQSAAIIRDVLEGQQGPAREMIVLNAAAALWTARRDSSLENCATLASEAIDSGAAKEQLAKLVAVSNSD